MDEINKRLIQLMKAFNLSPSLFADEVGVIRPAISHIVSGRNKPGLELLQKILKRFPEVSADWLLLGSEPMIEKEEELSPNTGKQSKIDQINEFTNVNSVLLGGNSDVPDPISPINSNKIVMGSNERINRITVYYNDGTYADFYSGK